MGPTTNKAFLADGRRYVDTDRGPWRSTEEYISALSKRERDCIQRLKQFPKAEGIFGGAGSYIPTAKAKLAVLRDFEKLARSLLPRDPSVQIPVLWHTDLHHDNIFVDPMEPSKVLHIIDWQSVHSTPLFQQVRTPAFLDFIGPQPPEHLAKPTLPENFEQLSPTEQDQAKALLRQQSLYKSYEILSAQANMPVYNALRYSNTLGCQIIALVSQIFNDGETIIRGQLIQAEREWKKITGENGLPCPFTVSKADIESQAVEQQKWEEGVQRMEGVLNALGGAENGWYGWVSHEEYDQLKERLDIVKAQFLDHESNNEEDRRAWERAWPFQDRTGVL